MPHAKGFAHRRDRRSDEPVPIGDVVDAILREDVFARGMPVVKLIKAWPELVGDRLAGATTPVSLEAQMPHDPRRRRPVGVAGEVLLRGDPFARGRGARRRCRDRREGGRGTGRRGAKPQVTGLIRSPRLRSIVICVG